MNAIKEELLQVRWVKERLILGFQYDGVNQMCTFLDDVHVVNIPIYIDMSRNQHSHTSYTLIFQDFAIDFRSSVLQAEWFTCRRGHRDWDSILRC